MSVAQTYANALLEAGKDAKKTSSADLDRFEKELLAAAEWTETHSQLRAAIFGTAVKLSEKAKVIEEVATKSGFDPLTIRFLVLLARKGRFSSTRDILNAFRLKRLENEGGVLGKVISAEPLNEEDVQGLVQAFEKKLGKKVKFEVSVDTQLIAGLRVTLQGTTYDGSLRSQLDRAKTVLMNR